jgi:hypothetical protein
MNNKNCSRLKLLTDPKSKILTGTWQRKSEPEGQMPFEGLPARQVVMFTHLSLIKLSSSTKLV